MAEANAEGRPGRLIASCGVIWTTNGRPPTDLIALFHSSFTANLESFWPFLPDLTSGWVAALGQSCDIASCLPPLRVSTLRISLDFTFERLLQSSNIGYSQWSGLTHLRKCTLLREDAVGPRRASQIMMDDRAASKGIYIYLLMRRKSLINIFTRP